MTLPSQDQLLEAIEKTDKLLPAARTLGRALQLLRDLNSSLIEIAELINCDSALAVEVLRCANSAYYGRSSRVGSIGEAMNVIGFGETKRFVSLAVANKTTNRDLKAYGISARDYWEESLFNGYFLEALMVRIGVGDPAEAYIVGLLRFVGRLVIDHVIEDGGETPPWDGTQSLSEWERTLVGLTQAEVGGKLLRKWNFPERLSEALEAQSNAIPKPDHLGSPLADCMRFAAEILPEGKRFTAINPKTGGAIPCQEDHPFLVANRLNLEAIAAVYQAAYGSYSTIREMLRVASSSKGDSGAAKKASQPAQDWDF